MKKSQRLANQVIFYLGRLDLIFDSVENPSQVQA